MKTVTTKEEMMASIEVYNQRIREIACQCAAQAIGCLKDQESPIPLLWSFTVFFEKYIHEGSQGTREEFGPSEPIELKGVS